MCGGTPLNQWRRNCGNLVRPFIALTRGLRQHWRDTSIEAARLRSIDEAVFRAVEISIDQMMRRGEATDANIREAVRDITETYYGKRVGNGNR